MQNKYSFSLEKPIIFVGLGRSGTSIISEVVFQHEDLAWPSNYQNRYPNRIGINRIRPILDNRLWHLRGQKPQLNKIPAYNKYTFKPSEAYAFWNYISGPRINFSRSFLLKELATLEEKAKIRDLLLKMIYYQRRKRLAFKITGPGRIGYLHSLFPDAIFIEIIREPFSNIRSLLKVPFWKKNGMYNLAWHGAYSNAEYEQVDQWKGRPELITALQYKKVRETTRQEFEIYNVHYHSISYENFVENPSEIIKKIMTCTGLQESSAIRKYLNNNKIYNRNIDGRDFFGLSEQRKLTKLLDEFI